MVPQPGPVLLACGIQCSFPAGAPDRYRPRRQNAHQDRHSDCDGGRASRPRRRNTTSCPSEVTASAATGAVWPARVARSRPVFGSHTFTVPSPLAEKLRRIGNQ